MTRILAIAGSLSHPSQTYGILEYAARLSEKEGLHNILATVYAVDKQIQKQPDDSVLLDEEM